MEEDKFLAEALYVSGKSKEEAALEICRIYHEDVMEVVEDSRIWGNLGDHIPLFEDAILDIIVSRDDCIKHLDVLYG